MHTNISTVFILGIESNFLLGIHTDMSLNRYQTKHNSILLIGYMKAEETCDESYIFINVERFLLD